MILALPLHDDNPTSRTPVVTYALIGICAAVFFWQLTQDDDAVAVTYGLIPATLFGAVRPPLGLPAIPAWETIFTSMFLHADWLHIAGNMLFLWIFGNNIEDLLGAFRYALLYLASGLAAALCQVLSDPASSQPMLGASGAIAGVLGAYLMIFPQARVHVLVWIVIFARLVAVPAWIVLGAWFALQLLSGLASSADVAGVAFWAHVGGFVAGCGLILVLRPRGVPLWQEAKTEAFVARRVGPWSDRPPPPGRTPDDASRRVGPWGERPRQPDDPWPDDPWRNFPRGR